MSQKAWIVQVITSYLIKYYCSLWLSIRWHTPLRPWLHFPKGAKHSVSVRATEARLKIRQHSLLLINVYLVFRWIWGGAGSRSLCMFWLEQFSSFYFTFYVTLSLTTMSGRFGRTCSLQQLYFPSALLFWYNNNNNNVILVNSIIALQQLKKHTSLFSPHQSSEKRQCFTSCKQLSVWPAPNSFMASHN